MDMLQKGPMIDAAGLQRQLHDRVDNNAQAHILAATLGPSETVAIDDGDLVHGRWQGIMLVELDGPRERKIAVSVLPA